jgi:hypothetical protein
VIRYRVAGAGVVRLELFDMLGRHISTLVERALPSGEYSRVLETAELPPGIYLCRLTGGDGRGSAAAVLHNQ